MTRGGSLEVTHDVASQALQICHLAPNTNHRITERTTNCELHAVPSAIGEGGQPSVEEEPFGPWERGQCGTVLLSQTSAGTFCIGWGSVARQSVLGMEMGGQPGFLPSAETRIPSGDLSRTYSQRGQLGLRSMEQRQ